MAVRCHEHSMAQTQGTWEDGNVPAQSKVARATPFRFGPQSLLKHDATARPWNHLPTPFTPTCFDPECLKGGTPANGDRLKGISPSLQPSFEAIPPGARASRPRTGWSNPRWTRWVGACSERASEHGWRGRLNLCGRASKSLSAHRIK